MSEGKRARRRKGASDEAQLHEAAQEKSFAILRADAFQPVRVPNEAIMLLMRREHRTPHAVLGAHPAIDAGVHGVVVRAFNPRADTMDVLVGDNVIPMERQDTLFVAFLPGRALPLRYRLRAHYADGSIDDREDAYRFLPTLGEVDLHLIGEGRHLRLWEKLGAHPTVIDNVAGCAFAVWAPNAAGVSLIGSFNGWDGRMHPMRALGASGVFELFVPGVDAGAMYKYEIRSRTGQLRVKTDPIAFALEQGIGHASIVMGSSDYAWQDAEWLARRTDGDPVREPMLVYEVHLASWARGEDNRMLTYRELAPRIAQHVTALGFTHIELLPVQEHPFGGSWGYQVGAYFAPTGRHGSPDDFRFFVDTMHRAGIGVLLDWVPAHFPKDDWALRRFDGTACYEHEDPRLGEHPEWGTMIFNYGRHEVRNFLLANALFWLEEYHLDGLRVDAVASMLYLDYGREAGQWLRNRLGGRENLEAVSFIKQLNHTVRSLHPGVMMIAEESTTWPRVTHSIADGGLGFTFKWNMGWMHDTLDYFRVDPFFRKGAHDKLTFAMMYEYSERFVNPLSHDEVVHLKRSLLEKMPGDLWQKLANLRVLIGYSITRPGKSLFFMGTELAPHREWNHDASLDWSLTADPRRKGLQDFIGALSALYREHSCFWKRDHEPSGFSWIDVADKEQSLLSYARFDGGRHAVIIMNLTPVPRSGYRIGTPTATTYRYALNSDDVAFGGSGFAVPEQVTTEASPYHGFPNSVELVLPPLSIVVLMPVEGAAAVADAEETALSQASMPSIAPGSTEAITSPAPGSTEAITSPAPVSSETSTSPASGSTEASTSPAVTVGDVALSEIPVQPVSQPRARKQREKTPKPPKEARRDVEVRQMADAPVDESNGKKSTKSGKKEKAAKQSQAPASPKPPKQQKKK